MLKELYLLWLRLAAPQDLHYINGADTLPPPLPPEHERAALRGAVGRLSPRERRIMELRFGLVDGVERDFADLDPNEVETISVLKDASATAVFGAYFKLQTFIFMPIFGISSGLIPILSYNYGSGALRRVSASVRFGQQFTAVLSLSGALLLSLLASPLLRSAFRASPEALAMGAPALRIIALSFFFAGTSIIFCSAFQSLGRSRWSLLVALLRQILLLLPAAALLLALKPALVWAAFPLSELISCFAAALLYRRTIQKQLL